MKPIQASDAELVDACRNGDPAAWAALVNRYQRLIYSIARRSGLDQEHAAEVFQHVFEMLASQINRIKQPDRVRMWLIIVAQREAWGVKQKMVSAQQYHSIEAEEVTQGLADRAPLPDAVVLQAEDHHLVRTALSRLDERCRLLLSLLFLSQASPSYAEVAKSLDIAVGSIGPTRARCLEKMRCFLHEMGY